MAVYQAKSNTNVSFEVTKDGKSIGKLTYKSWFKFNALMDFGHNVSYQVEPKGFWGTTIEIKDRDKVLLKFKMNWNGQIVVQTYFNGIEKDYVFKQRGLFNQSFMLVDKEGMELLAMKPHIKWNNMNYEFDITTSDIFETISNKEILLMTSLHCANYYMSMATSM